MRHLVVVLGMHRSGTSVVARSLQALGVALGVRAEWCMPDNPKGFWEHLDILAVNETLLGQIGHRWDDADSWQSSLVTCVDPKILQLAQLGHHILEAEISRASLFGIKEPRLCRLLTFWRPIFAALDCKVSVVHVVRHPVAVAGSLLRRNGLPIERGLALWLEYTNRQFLDIEPAWRSVVVLYDDMMASPVQQVARIGTALGLDCDKDQLKIFVEGFVDQTLRHEPLESTGSLTAEIAQAWAAVEAKILT